MKEIKLISLQVKTFETKITKWIYWSCDRHDAYLWVNLTMKLTFWLCLQMRPSSAKGILKSVVYEVPLVLNYNDW